jgi:hypothetical protein
MKFSVQYVNRLNDETQSYDMIGALVLDEKAKVMTPVSLAPVYGDEWAADMREYIARWGESLLDLQTRLVDQNGTRTTYSFPDDISAGSVLEAAEKAQQRR